MSSDIKDTNVELIGSSADIAQRVAAAKQEEEWKGAGTAAGIEIWRIEKFNVKRIPKDKHGTFYDGDSYIVLRTEKNGGGDSSVHEFNYDLHFWIGSKSSIDEQGVAAYKTVELDDLLHGRPVQYRESQGNETSQFLSFFPKGVKILPGGIASGFKQVVATLEAPRLVQLKGKVVVQSMEVPALASSLNHGDAFVLDAGVKIFIWRGNKSKPTERFAAVQYADIVRQEHEGKPEIVTLEDEGNAEFWGLLKGSHADVKSAEEGGDDAAAAKKRDKQLYHLVEKSGKYNYELVAQGENITMASFKSDDVFILYTQAYVFVWIGKNADANERKFSLPRAMHFIKVNNVENGVPVQRVLEGHETAAFKAAFK